MIAWLLGRRRGAGGRGPEQLFPALFISLLFLFSLLGCLCLSFGKGGFVRLDIVFVLGGLLAGSGFVVAQVQVPDAGSRRTS
jgi:hypothetical protein